MDTRPYRSVLYIPGSKKRALDKATCLAADAIIFDLEDAVAPDDKAKARQTLADALITKDYGSRIKIVRINGFDTAWADDDLTVIAAAQPDAILLPKVNTAVDVQALATKLDAHPQAADTRIWCMMETPLGMLNAAEIATASPRIAGFVMGTNDLAKELNSRSRPDRLAMQTGLGLCLLAAKSYGLLAIDGVYNAFKDASGLRMECDQGRDMGFDGKSLIHPAQIDVANAAFAPSDAEIALSQRQIAAFEQAEAEGLGVAVVDGKIVENLHIVTARSVLAKAKAIQAMSAESR